MEKAGKTTVLLCPEGTCLIARRISRDSKTWYCLLCLSAKHFFADPGPFDTDPDPGFQFYTDPDPYRFKEVMYLKRYFLYLFLISLVMSIGPTGPTKPYSLLNFPVQLILLCSLE